MAFTLPWSFRLYDRSYTSIYMCTNGWLSFTNNTANNYLAGNSPLPAANSGTPVNTLFAVLWDDLYFTSGVGSTRIYSDTENHRVIFSWMQAQRYDDRNVRANAQAILYQDGRIEYQYGTISGTVNSATVGVQNFNGTLYSQVWADGVAIPPQHALALDAQRVWARPSLTTATIPAGGDQTVNFMWDARGTVHDTTFTGTWTFVGNVVPFALPFTLHAATIIEGAQPTQVPLYFTVSEAYPNPFNPTATIDFTLERTSNVKMTVYDITGREVTTLLNGSMAAGNHRQMINASSWATGVYFVKVHAGDHQAVRKLLLLK